MNFWSSAEIFGPAFATFSQVDHLVEPFLNAQLAASVLATLEGELRYVPIVMPDDMRARYPERSKLRRSERIYVCAPQLDYEVFVDGTFEEALEEYLCGLAPAASHLAGLGASARQIEVFRTIIKDATLIPLRDPRPSA